MDIEGLKRNGQNQRAQAATNGSPHPRVLNPGPSSFWAGDRNAAHQPQKYAFAVTRARGAADARPRNRRKSRERHLTPKKNAHVACGEFSNEQNGRFPKKRLGGDSRSHHPAGEKINESSERIDPQDPQGIEPLKESDVLFPERADDIKSFQKRRQTT